MLKFLIFFLSIVTVSIVQSQTFTVTPNPVNIVADLNTAVNTYEIVAESVITNNTSDTLYLKWERIVNNKPDCWETSVFGVWIQSPPFIDSLEFDLYPNNDGAINISAFTGLAGGVPNAGEAEVVLKITNLFDPLDTLLVEYHFTVAGDVNCITSISDIEKEALKIYPNPTTDFFQLSGMQEIQQLLIFNILGHKVKQFDVIHNQSYNISDMPDGVYLVKMVGRKQQIVKTVKLQIL